MDVIIEEYAGEVSKTTRFEGVETEQDRALVREAIFRRIKSMEAPDYTVGIGKDGKA